MIIDCICPECKGDYGAVPQDNGEAYQIFSVKEFLCWLCFEEFVYGEEE